MLVYRKVFISFPWQVRSRWLTIDRFLYRETAKFVHEMARDPAGGTDGQDLWAEIGRYTYSNFAMQAMGFEVRFYLHIFTSRTAFLKLRQDILCH